jgi:hypothetical protein
MNGIRRSALLFAAIGTCTSIASADEIRLKDGKKLSGVIVAYEDNMFKIKTDFGFVLVEKDKIASIVPTTPAAASASSGGPTGAKTVKPPEKKTAVVTATAVPTEPAHAGVAEDTASAKPKIFSEPIRPELPGTAKIGKVAPPALKSPVAAQTEAAAAIAVTAPPPAPKEPELPAMKEKVQGTLYTNFSHGFKMYKAPSWEIIEDARRALPNAIVAMGTSNESTLMVVGQEQSKDSLDVCANSVEKRMREIYSNYKMLSRRKSTVGGAPAIEYKYTGKADDVDWSGTLVVVARTKDVLTLLGMTHADNDLIQIQENVIARAINSTDFNVQP